MIINIRSGRAKAPDPISAAPSNGGARPPGNGIRRPSGRPDSLELRDLLRVLIAARDGDFTIRLPSE